MEAVLREMREMVEGFENPFLLEMFAHLSSGKMLRSAMVLSITGETPQSLKLCAIIELIQLASLLHDDVIDGSAMRRGRQSLNARFGPQSAIMLGDALYAKAFYHLVSPHLASLHPKIAQSLSNAVCKLSSGEIYDVFLSARFNTSKEQYFLMIEEKTASLIASSAECAALLAGLDSEAYFHYGRSLGLAFQIVDDILDLTQSQETLGKPAMSDLREGKMTLPYLLWFEALDVEGRARLQGLCGKRDLSEADLAWIQSGTQEPLRRSREIANQIARDALSKLPRPYDPKLEKIIETVLERSF